MDAILESFVRDFAEHFGYEPELTPRLFELFVNRTVIARLTQDELDLEKVSVGDGGDLGIDGITILVSGHPVLTTEDIDFFLDRGNADIEFVFTQAKTSPSFNAAELGSFLEGVLTFFQKELPPHTNDSVRQLWALKTHIYAHTVKLEHAPTCRCYYAATGEWRDDAVCRERARTGIQRLADTSLFSEKPLFTPLDAAKLKTLYRSLCHRVTCEIEFEKNTSIPAMGQVREAYLGLLSCKEFLRLIMDDDGEMRPNLFYNNVRDFQGDTPVNQEIASALCDPCVCQEFALLNNGVTVVARSINRIGDRFKLTDFQIVNGCQTSNVLYQHRDKVAANSSLPVKLIVTDDSEVTNRIIRATNRQTEVKPEAFESLAPFHRTLEDFYNAMADKVDPRLYYERRSKQYIHQNIKQYQVVTLAGQCAAFLAMFCDEPHSTHRYYGEILRASRGRLFREEHQPFPYFLSAYALNRLELLFNHGDVAKHYRTYRYHLLLLIRHAIAGSKLPPLNGKDINAFCERVLKEVQSPAALRGHVAEACRAIDKCLSTYDQGGAQGNPPDRRRDFTHQLVPNVLRTRPRGKVVHYNLERGFGFVRPDGGDGDVFVHHTGIRERVHRYLREGDVVEFDVVSNPRGKQAENVVVLPQPQP